MPFVYLWHQLLSDRCSETANNVVISKPYFSGQLVWKQDELTLQAHFWKKDYAYLWKPFNDVRTITGCFILAEGYFSFWLRVISTILPLFCLWSHHFHPPQPSPKQPFWELVSWLSRCLKRTKHFFPTTWPLSLKSWSASTLDHLYPLLPLPFISPFYPSMDIFILRMLDVWATACGKWYFHCPPVVEMDFE